jgi:hypothetical protein
MGDERIVCSTGAEVGPGKEIREDDPEPEHAEASV